MLTQPISQETNLVGRIVNVGVTSTTLTIYAQFEDKKTGVARTPQATTKLFTLSKDTERFEMILADSHSTTDGITTITVNATGRNLQKYGNLSGSATGNKHPIGSEIGCAEVHIPLEVLNEIIRGDEATGSAGFTIGTSAVGTITLYRSTGSATKVGVLRWDVTSGKAEYSNDGSTWNSFDSVSASNVVVVSGADTTPGGLNDKITVSGSGITKSITSPGGDEKLNLAVSANEYVDVTYTAAEAIAENYLVSKTNTDNTVELTVRNVLTTGGTEAEFAAGVAVDCVVACQAAQDKVAVFYRDTTNSLGKLVIGTIPASTKTITWGTPVSLGFDVGSTSICYMGEDKIIIGYRNAVDDKVYAQVWSISDTVPTPGTAKDSTFTNAASGQGKVVVGCIDTDKIVVGARHEGDSNKGYVECATVSGTTIGTWGTAVTFLTTGAANAVSNIAITKAATDKFVVFCRNEGDSNKGKGALGVASGTAITMATEVEIDANASSEFSADTNVVTWIGGASGYVMSRVFTVTGLTLAYPAAAVTVNGAAALTPRVILGRNISGNSYSAYAVYEESGASDGKFNKLICDIVTGSIVPSAQYGFNGGSDNIAQCAIAKVNENNKFVVAYKDEADSNKGNAECFQDYNNIERTLGLAQSSVATGASVVVREKGLATIGSLTTGMIYSAGSTSGGLLVTGATGVQVGIAKSTTVLDVNIQRVGKPPVTTVYSMTGNLLSADTAQFDITNPVGTTFRYTYDGTGANPGISAATAPVGTVVVISVASFNVANRGTFTITSSGTNYFEVINASGVAENNKVVGAADYIRKISSVYTWFKPINKTFSHIEVEVQGGGGGAAGAASSAQASGAAGGYSKKTISAATLSGVEAVTVTVGTGGAGGSANNNGAAGGTSSFGSYLSATGGAATTTGGGTAGLGGVGSNGDLNLYGEPGIHDGVSASRGVNGGSSQLGVGGLGASADDTKGGNGLGYGAGGGGCRADASPTASGGDGAPGVVIVKEVYL
jgi:hypothetical protein